MKRRNFIKQSCSLCFGLTGIAIFESQLSSCKAPYQLTQVSVVDGTITVPIQSFQNDNMLMLRVKNLEHDLLVIKSGESNYRTLYLQCSHQNNPLVVTRDQLFCSAHGSSFDLDGTVTKAPANAPLLKLNTSIKNEQIIIKIPIHL